jgi:hypothetical protein
VLQIFVPGSDPLSGSIAISAKSARGPPLFA